MSALSRRTFVQQTTALIATGTISSATPRPLSAPVPAPVPAIDTHTHFYDPTRTQGVPWPPPHEKLLYQPYYPSRFRALTAPLGIVGTVVVEASPWVEDNQWILDLAKDNDDIVAFIGNLDLTQMEFAARLNRFSRNPLFRGLRLGEKAIAEGLGQRVFDDNLQRLGERKLTLDVLGGAAMLQHIPHIVRLAPNLRIVIDHLPFASWDGALAVMSESLKPVARLPHVYAKVSNVVRGKDGQVIEDLAVYRPALDVLWELFGADRLLYGSNWPVSERIAPYASLHKIVAAYFAEREPAVGEKFFWRNSLRAYGWLPRGQAKRLGK